MSHHALIFGARKLAESLLRRHTFKFTTDEIVKWAKKCAADHQAMSGDPGWWIGSAIADIECLDACFEMLKK